MISEQHNKFWWSIWTAELNHCWLAMQQLVLGPAEKKLAIGSSSRKGPIPPHVTLVHHESHPNTLPPELRNFFPCWLLRETNLPGFWTGTHYSVLENLNRNDLRSLVDYISSKWVSSYLGRIVEIKSASSCRRQMGKFLMYRYKT